MLVNIGKMQPLLQFNVTFIPYSFWKIVEILTVHRKVTKSKAHKI